jgi:hypothetical protein
MIESLLYWPNQTRTIAAKVRLENEKNSLRGDRLTGRLTRDKYFGWLHTPEEVEFQPIKHAQIIQY